MMNVKHNSFQLDYTLNWHRKWTTNLWFLIPISRATELLSENTKYEFVVFAKHESIEKTESMMRREVCEFQEN